MHGSAYLQQNPSSPWYHQLQIDENNKPAVDLNDLLKNTYMPKLLLRNIRTLTITSTIWTILNKNPTISPFPS